MADESVSEANVRTDKDGARITHTPARTLKNGVVWVV